MGLISFLRGTDIDQKALTGTPTVLETLASRQFSPIPLGGTTYNYGRINSVYVEAQNATYGWMYLYQPSVRRVVDYIAQNVSQLGLKVFERLDDDEREQRGDHPAARLLRKPNPHTPGVQFIYELFSDFLVYDNAYALKFRNPKTGTFDAIVRLEPPMVGLVGRSHFTVDAYRVYLQDGSSFDVQPQDMIHWRGYNPSDPRRGESKLETLREVLAADLTSRKAVTEQFRAGLTASGWIERPLESPQLSPEAFERLRKSVTNQMASSRREFPILEEGMAFKQASITPEDAQYLEARDKAVEEVCAAFGLPPVPPTTEEGRKQFYADVLPPYMTRCCSFLNLQVLQQEYDAEDFYFEFGRDKVMDEIYKTLTSASGRPVLLTDEARAKLDLPPVPTGDELVTPANVIVGDNPKPSIGVMPIQDPNKPPQDGSHRTEDAPVMNGNGNGKSLLPRRRAASQRRNRWAEKEYEPVVKKHLTRQRSLTKSQKKSVTDDHFNKELADDLYPLYRQQFAAEGSRQGARMMTDFDASQGKNYLRKKADETAKDFNEVTQAKIDEKGIEDAFAEAIAFRAGAFAMATATDVQGFATKEAERQADGDYFVNISGGSCEVCAPFQGSWPAKDVPGWPAYHANCNCVADIGG